MQPKAKITLIDTLKGGVKAHGEDPERHLLREAFTVPHSTCMESAEREEDGVKVLNQVPL